jgi:hypothetical protein
LVALLHPVPFLLQGTVVAIKRLLTNDAVTIERFVSEVRMLARLRHPNLILFMGYCTMPELCIISEYMSKGSLYSVLHSPEQRKQRAAVAKKQQRQQQQQSEGDADAAARAGSSSAAAAAFVLAAAPSQDYLALELAGTPQEQQQRRLEALEPKIQRLVAVAVARGMAYLHTRSPPILHLVSFEGYCVAFKLDIDSFVLLRRSCCTVLVRCFHGVLCHLLWHWHCLACCLVAGAWAGAATQHPAS